VEERRGGFKAAILRELGFPVSKRRLSVWIMFINDEPMAAILAALGDRPDFFMLLKVDYKGKARRLIGGPREYSDAGMRKKRRSLLERVSA